MREDKLAIDDGVDEALDFETAAIIRDEIYKLEGKKPKGEEKRPKRRRGR